MSCFEATILKMESKLTQELGYRFLIVRLFSEGESHNGKNTELGVETL